MNGLATRSVASLRSASSIASRVIGGGRDGPSASSAGSSIHCPEPEPLDPALPAIAVEAPGSRTGRTAIGTGSGATDEAGDGRVRGVASAETVRPRITSQIDELVERVGERGPLDAGEGYGVVEGSDGPVLSLSAESCLDGTSVGLSPSESSVAHAVRSSQPFEPLRDTRDDTGGRGSRALDVDASELARTGPTLAKLYVLTLADAG